MVSPKVYELCRSPKTVSSELALDPTMAPGKIAEKLYGKDVAHIDEHKSLHEASGSAEDLKRASKCGKWGPKQPSELFLKMYNDILSTLEHDPLCGMTSPPLMGSCGVVPLTIISPLPDICRHMSNCIARAEKEVFLATNYWQSSDASTLITNALKELSIRAGKRGQKAIVKIMYDRGNAKQVLENHQPVSVDEYTGKNVRMPSPEEIPNVDLQVLNYHRPIFGTFHSKYMVVDRRIAIVSSNNIQDNDNVEMMVHLEGPIVDSFYDMSLLSWHNELKPPLPCLSSPAAQGGLPSFEHESHKGMFDEHGFLKNLTGYNSNPIDPQKTFDSSTAAAQKEPGFEAPNYSETTEGQNFTAIAQAGTQQRLPEHSFTDPHYDEDIAGEVLRAQSVLSPKDGESRMHAVTRHLNTTLKTNQGTTGSAPECEPGDEMTTYIPLPAHDLVPMAMVCRKPWGSPSDGSLHVPQNAAFMAGLRYAKKNVFIQTPNLNAKALLPEIIAAVKRGIDVFYFVCLGYNDSGELLPGQGGTNEMIANKLYGQLTPAEKDHLHIFNYVGKDQTHPIHNKFKHRSCHIKLMIVDEHVGICGNGNQDTQSWYHSQEVNVMIDSQTICGAWAEGIRRNQNTHLYGAVSKEDGCWHDDQGKQADGAIGTDPGHFSWAKGIVGAVQRVRGAGGF